MEQHPGIIDDLAPHQAEMVDKAEHGGSDEFDLEDKPIGRFAAAYHKFASVTALSLMTVFIALEVVSRYVLGAGLRWSQELCCLSLFIMVIACQAHCWQKDRHIKLHVLYDRMPRPLKNCCNALTVVCGALFFGALAYQIIVDIPYQFAINEATEELHIPNWYIGAGALVGCVLILAMYLRWFAALFSGSRRAA